MPRIRPRKNTPRLRATRRLGYEVLEDRRVFSGLTLITHGWNSSVDDWVDQMANAIQARVPVVPGTDPPGAGTAEYTLKIFGSSPENITGYSLDRGPAGSTATAEQASSGEVVVKLDWSAIDTQWESASHVGDYVADLLLTNFGLPDGFDYLAGPIQLIGHSRGASLNTSIAERLAERGVWIDQFTALDPHPVEWINGEYDAPMALWDTVRFADNYWQPVYFDGEEIEGAFNLYFPDGSFPGGYAHNHLDIHLWYHGTIDTTGAIDDGSASVSEDAGWYAGAKGPRDQIGYYSSRIVGGGRTGAAAAGIADASRRVFVPRVGTQWPNLESPLVYGGSQTVTQGTAVPLVYRYQATSDSTITFGYDADRNPSNGWTVVATVNRAATSSGVAFDDGVVENHALATNSMPTGASYLVAQIASAGHRRYAYTEDPITLVPGSLPSWHNPALAPDVNGDQGVTAQDVLAVVNYINSHPNQARLPPPPAEPHPYYDVNDDGLCTPLDALIAINYINRGGNAAGEGEAIVAARRGTVLEAESLVWLADEIVSDHGVPGARRPVSREYAARSMTTPRLIGNGP